MIFFGGGWDGTFMCVFIFFLAVYKVISYNCRPAERVTPQAYPEPFSDT